MTGDYLIDRKIANIKKFLNSYNLVYGSSFAYTKDSDYEKSQEKYDYIFKNKDIPEEIILVQHTTQSEVRKNSTIIADENIFYNKIIPRLDEELKSRKLNIHIYLDMKQFALRSIDVETFISEICLELESVDPKEEFRKLKLPYEISQYFNSIEYSKGKEPYVIGIGINLSLDENSHQDLLYLLKTALERKNNKHEEGIILMIDFISYPFLDEERLEKNEKQIKKLAENSHWKEIWLVNDFALEAFRIK